MSALLTVSFTISGSTRATHVPLCSLPHASAPSLLPFHHCHHPMVNSILWAPNLIFSAICAQEEGLSNWLSPGKRKQTSTHPILVSDEPKKWLCPSLAEAKMKENLEECRSSQNTHIGTRSHSSMNNNLPMATRSGDWSNLVLSLCSRNESTCNWVRITYS